MGPDVVGPVRGPSNSFPLGSGRSDDHATAEFGPTPVSQLLDDATARTSEGRRWQRSYRRQVLAVDSIVVIAAVVLAQIGRFDLFGTESSGYVSWERATALSVGLALTWLVALGVLQSRDISLVGIGSEEYRRVVSATAWVFGLAAVTSLILQTQLSRGYLMIALPIGLVGLLAGRHAIRRNLAKKRLRGEFVTRVLILGKPEQAAVLCTSLDRSKEVGYSVAGVCIPDYDGAVGQQLITSSGALPILGDENSVEVALRLTGADALAVTAVEQLGHEKMRKLAWRLDSLGVDIIVVPGMTDIAGPRLKLRPIDNLPLFHIARPNHGGPSMYGKRAFDLIFGTAALAVLLPAMVITALAIKCDDGGPVFFRQDRVGQHGKLFRILKFRSMSVDAEIRKGAEQSKGGNAGVFFKSASDSRVTRVGRLIRATSVDELPQLFNVLGGSMSIVGPRPLVPGEGESVEDFVARRALVKPGITGLWQVSGRSDVSEEERIRLDHSYVDNWSCVQDLVIVWRTARAVLNRDGAY
ncbi:sugar transferase [Mycolicibacterium komossense]|uniref:Sugar transferase n=1 Tax=Mycolicibacterium komossense TaxID=1779 RepID=A0ABT3CCI7_9MYCO|nr:sugar transferase [Mycolicibacterium komossense]MCV7227162.1 sugar transferase [Mycolicibacterium komossense]